jgi:hypothetical protein
LVNAFPIDPVKYRDTALIRPTVSGQILEANAERSDLEITHDLKSRVSGTLVALRIDKWGLKDAQTYIEPRTTVLVTDSRGAVLDAQDTPHATEKRVTHVVFEHTIYLRVSFEEMQRKGAAIFFEFKHYKPKKKKVSTRCWCFMELNELKPDQELVLEIYHKPTDLNKKKLKLHSVKSLYFHCTASLSER